MTGHGRRFKERNEWREELEAEHRPKQVQRRLTERRSQSYLGDAILLPLVPFLIPNLTADTRLWRAPWLRASPSSLSGG